MTQDPVSYCGRQPGGPRPRPRQTQLTCDPLDNCEAQTGPAVVIGRTDNYCDPMTDYWMTDSIGHWYWTLLLLLLLLVLLIVLVDPVGSNCYWPSIGNDPFTDPLLIDPLLLLWWYYWWLLTQLAQTVAQAQLAQLVTVIVIVGDWWPSWTCIGWAQLLLIIVLLWPIDCYYWPIIGVIGPGWRTQTVTQADNDIDCYYCWLLLLLLVIIVIVIIVIIVNYWYWTVLCIENCYC